MECSCSIDGCCDGDEYDEHEEKILIAGSDIKCGECGREINHGEEYELFRGEYEDEEGEVDIVNVHHTCLDCLSLRNNFFDSWTFADLWDDFNSSMDDCFWEVPEACLSKVTPQTRARICASIEDYWEESTE